MFEFMRYTLLVVFGLACIVAMFISLAITGSIVAQNGQYEAGFDASVASWTLGLTAAAITLWLSSTFLIRIPLTILNWVYVNKDQLTGYVVISLIFMIFVVS